MSTLLWLWIVNCGMSGIIGFAWGYLNCLRDSEDVV
jgi:hypothetical protein